MYTIFACFVVMCRRLFTANFGLGGPPLAVPGDLKLSVYTSGPHPCQQLDRVQSRVPPHTPTLLSATYRS